MDVEIQRSIKPFANMFRRMREILQVWRHPILENGNRGVKFSKDSRIVML
jgi:hypothetical protein